MDGKVIKLDAYFEKSTIFKNSKVFTSDYIPNHFLYREKEVDKLARAFASLKDGTEMHVWCNGPPSTGKTHVIAKLTKEFNQYSEANNLNLKYIYASARRKTITQFYFEIIRQFDENYSIRGRGAGEMVDTILRHANRFEAVNFIFDELDRIEPSSQYSNPINTLISIFTRLHEWNSRFKTRYMLTVITNDMNIHRHLDSSTASTFVAQNHFFAGYDAVKFSHILWDRCEAGFYTSVIETEDVDWLGATLCRGVKDLRTGLKILSTAGKMTEENRGKKIDKEIIKKASIEVEKNKLIETVAQMDDAQVLLLLSVARVQRHKPDELVTSNDVCRKYYSLADEFGMMKLKPRYINESIAPQVESIGLITTAIRGRGRGRGVAKSYQIMGEDLQEIISVTGSELEKRRYPIFNKNTPIV